MNTNKVILLAAVLIVLVACNSKPTPPAPAGKSNAAAIDGRFAAVDSMVTVMYKDPYGKDSISYTRYYDEHGTSDDSAIDAMRTQLSAGYAKTDYRKGLRSEGKVRMYFNGKVGQVLYFSTDCARTCFTYFIHEGNYYYSEVSPGFSRYIFSLKGN